MALEKIHKLNLPTKNVGIFLIQQIFEFFFLIPKLRP